MRYTFKLNIIMLVLILISCTNNNEKGLSALRLNLKTIGKKFIKVGFYNDGRLETIHDFAMAKKIALSPIAKNVSSLIVYDNDDVFDEFLYNFTGICCLKIASINANTYAVDFNKYGKLDELIFYESSIDSLFILDVNFAMIKSIEISMCKIKYIGHGLERFTGLQSLDIYHCPNVNIVSNFSQLCSLQDLSITMSKLVEIPKGVEFCYNLTSIGFSNNYIDSIPESFTQLRNLKYYDFSMNVFETKPNVLIQLDQFVEAGSFFQSIYPLKTRELVALHHERSKNRVLKYGKISK